MSPLRWKILMSAHRMEEMLAEIKDPQAVDHETLTRGRYRRTPTGQNSDMAAGQ
jgi:hypothetical protein